MRLALRPQPLGVLPLPAGYLVLPDAPGAAELLPALMRGAPPPDSPGPLRFYALAARGDRDGALAALAGDDTPAGRYNRCVLEGDPAAYPALRAELAGELALLLDLVAYTLGWLADPPDPAGADGELGASALAARAAWAIERGDDEAALADLAAAVELARPASPALAARLLGDMAELRWQRFGPEQLAIQLDREALELLSRTELAEDEAGAALRLGMHYQELSGGRRGLLLEAARCYQLALKVFSRERSPELYALAQVNIALCYLAMPMAEASDKLKIGIAVQSLREALTVYTRERYPEEWASAQLNLANALQYMPSASPQDHLIEAVGLYEELAGVRDPRRDPLGAARVLANQGNALAHLGIMDHARAKLAEARRLFALGQDPESAAAVDELLAGLEPGGAEREQHGTVPAPAV